MIGPGARGDRARPSLANERSVVEAVDGQGTFEQELGHRARMSGRRLKPGIHVVQGRISGEPARLRFVLMMILPRMRFSSSASVMR